MDYKDTVDKWADDDDDDFCYGCDDWTEDDGHGNCKDCGNSYTTVDPFITPSVAKVYSSPAPTVSAYGDVWNRGSGYTWGTGSYWNSGVTTSAWGSWTQSTTDSARMLKHKRHLDSLCKVVDPNTKHTLHFATEKKNYSNMRTGTIYVDGTLIEDNDDKLDIVAGLSIHEKLHLVHTHPLTKWEKNYAYKNSLNVPQERLLHNIANIIEDEYIESQLAQTHAGYVMYIEKVKEHFFGKHGHKIDELSGNPIADVMNTLLAMVRYPQSISPERRKKHAKHIQFFARALKDALKNRDATFMAIDSLYNYMNQLATEEAKKREGVDEEELMSRADSKMKEILEEWGDTAGEMGEEDLERMKDRIIERERAEAERDGRYAEERKLEEALGKFVEELADYAKDRDWISESLWDDIESLADSDYSEEMWDTGRALGLKQGGKVTWKNQKANKDYYKQSYDEAVDRMKAPISQLKKKINLYGDTRINTIRNQRRGKLDKRMLHKIPLGRTDLFKNVIIDEDKPLDVCLLVDESGSMGSYKSRIARECAIGLREALKDNQALNLWVFGHTADGYEWGHEGETNMSVYWSPTYKSDLKAMGAMRARSENRDGMAILASADRVKAETPSIGSNKLMIVISDGEPSADKYRFNVSVPHTKKCVNFLEGQGWNIIQVGIDGAREVVMKQMFKNYIMVDDINELPTQVSKIIRKVIKV
jgi:cobalamin biosynthesis protein CobT